MENETVQHVLLPWDAPLALWLPVCLLLLAVWVRSHAWSRPVPRRWAPLAFAGRTLAGFLALLTAAQAAQGHIVFATNWRLWPLLLAGAIMIEAILALYRLERQVVPRRTGVALVILRGALALAALAMLCQPVLVFTSSRRIQRRVAVLLDESASMRVPDTNLTPAEKLRLSEALLLPAARRPLAIDTLAARLRNTRQELLAQTDWLNALSEMDPALRLRHLDKNSRGIRRALKEARATVAESTNSLCSGGSQAFLRKAGAAQTNLTALARQLAAEVYEPLGHALELSDKWRRASTNATAAYDGALGDLRRADAALVELDGRIGLAGDAVDEAFYRSLSDADRMAIDRVASLTRVDLARALLLNQPAGEDGKPASGAKPGLLERLDKEYGVLLYGFSDSPSEMRVKDLLASAGATNVAQAADSRHGRRTDIAAAMEKVAADARPEETAGILLLTDGRHNAAEPVEPIARKLGLQKVPVFPLVFGGSRHPPTDAAVAAVEAPESVSTNDRVSFDLELKLDGLAGSNVTVRLFDGGAAVASNTVTPTTDAFRKRIQLSDVPKTNGLHVYNVAVESFASEVELSNNVCRVPVLVGSDPVKVLLIDGYPRWEFRYLKNLFMERDKGVRLQYVLFHPDRIAGLTNRPPRAASAAPPDGESEATALPENESEWMKFDAVILGDVSPEDLGETNMAAMRKYVLSRGGALIVIAGTRHMPHAFAQTPLAEILPVVFTPSPRPMLGAPEPEFRLTLTAQGRDTVFMKLADDSAANLEAWSQAPSLHWRHGRQSAKEGATVLAYAQAPAAGPGQVPDTEALLHQQQHERDNALIVTHRAGFGAVLFLGFDHTWRLRYRKGDLYHRKFWGQVLRWVTADKIASGAALVRVGTDRSRYPTDAPIRIRARLAKPDSAPIVNAGLHATVWAGPRKVVRRQLHYVAESPGVYSAELGALPEGLYRVELDPSDLGAQGLDAGPAVSAEFAVSPEIRSESVELAADRGLLARLASLTAGAVLEPAELAGVAAKLGPAVLSKSDRRQIDLWNSWPWLILILGLFTAEWILRKKARLP